MDEDTAVQSCSSCGVAVSNEDLAEGLAIRVDGKPVCPLCVDTLPGSAKIKINQLRALRGFDVTTYRVPSQAHPHLNRFSFTTTAQLNQHRRTLHESGRYEAPVLPVDHAPIPRMAARALPTRRTPVLVFVGVGAGLVAVGSLIAVLTRTPARPVTTTDTPTVTIVQTTRADYPVAANQAWDEAAKDPSCPTSLLRSIADELIAERSKPLDVAQGAITAGDFALAMTTLDLPPLPDHLFLRSANARQTKIMEDLRMARLAVAQGPAQPPDRADPPTPPPVDPAPVPFVPVQPDPVAVVPPVAPEPVPETATNPPEPAIVPVGPVAPPPSSGDCFLFHATDLRELPGRQQWSTYPTTKTALQLDDDQGSLIRTLTLTGGRYQIWVRARGETGEVSLQVALGAYRSAILPLAKGTTAKWQRVPFPDDLIDAGDQRFQLIGIGKGVVVAQIYLANSAEPEPRIVLDSKRDTKVPWTDSEPTDIVPGSRRPSGTISLIEPTTTNTTTTVDAYNPSDRVPEGLPGGNDHVLVVSGNRGRKRHGVVIASRDYDLDKGGLALVVHPMRANRDRIEITFTGTGEENRTVPLPLTQGEWNTLAVPLPEGLTLPITTITIEDPVDVSPAHSTPFLLGKLVAVGGRPPAVEDLALHQAALRPLDPKSLADTLAKIANVRRWGRALSKFQPYLIKVLAGDRMQAGSWPTDVRKELKSLFKTELKGKDMPNGTISTLVLQDQWLDDLVTGKSKALDKNAHHLVVFCTAGLEMPVGLTPEQSVRNLWMPLLSHTLEAGYLPVAVLGPSKVDEAQLEAAEAMWNELAKAIPTGIPVIDLRQAKAASHSRMAPGMAALSIDLLTEGLKELADRIAVLQTLK